MGLVDKWDVSFLYEVFLFTKGYLEQNQIYCA